MNPSCVPEVCPVSINGLPPFDTVPGGVNPDPLALLQLTFQNVCGQLAWLSVKPKLNYTIDGVTASWDEHWSRLMESMEKLSKIPGVAPTINAPFQVNQFSSLGWGRWGGGW
jgi:hypothetical protein